MTVRVSPDLERYNSLGFWERAKMRWYCKISSFNQKNFGRNFDRVCEVCGEPIDICDMEYMVSDDTWDEMGMNMGCMHFGCLKERLGRKLNISDFPEEIPMNAGIHYGFKLGREHPDKPHESSGDSAKQ
jgi:hypothetical protein